MTDKLPSAALTRLLEQSESDYMTDRMVAIRERPDNPEGVEIATFGSATAIYSRTMPWPSFNTVKGFSTDNADDLEAIMDFYRSRGRKPQIEIVPSVVDSKTLQLLSEQGLYQSGFHVTLYRDLSGGEQEQAAGHWMEHDEAMHAAASAVHMREIDDDDFTTYATVHCRGTGLPDGGIASVAANNAVLARRPGWHFYLAEAAEGEAAAAAVMYSKSGVTSLTFAATLPQYRGRGLHRRLLAARMQQAQRLGDAWVVGQCNYASQSHRNMEALGMKIGYIKALWSAADR